MLADSYNGKRLNAPNDVVVKSDDSIWFTDPLFGINGEWEGFRAKPEQETTNVYRIDASGKITAVITDLVNPNGLAFSPDEKKLYVVEWKGTPNRSIWVYDVAADGTLSNKTKFYDAADQGALDGFRVDRDGNLWVGYGSNGALPGAGGGGHPQGVPAQGQAGGSGWRAGAEPAGEAHRLHQAAGTLCQPCLWRAEAEPALHDQFPFPLRPLCGEPRGRMKPVAPAPAGATSSGDPCRLLRRIQSRAQQGERRMGFIAMANRMAERAPLPDLVTRAGIEMLVARTRRELAAKPEGFERDFAREMGDFPIALHTDAANAQHYEIPPRFFELILGPRRKYSCCLYPAGTETLAEAEDIALAETVSHAGLADGQEILELGCGWGSLTLYMAERFPAARITAVSNSAPSAAISRRRPARGGSSMFGSSPPI